MNKIIRNLTTNRLGSLFLVALVSLLSILILNLMAYSRNITSHYEKTRSISRPIIPNKDVEVFSNIVMVRKNTTTGKWESKIITPPTID